MIAIFLLGTAALAQGLKGYCEPCDDDFRDGISWRSTDRNNNYQIDDRSAKRNDVYKTWVNQECPEGFTGTAWRYCTGNGQWYPPQMEGSSGCKEGVDCDGCQSSDCPKAPEKEIDWDTNKINLAKLQASCKPNTKGGEYCEVTCEEGFTPNVDRMRCWGGKWKAEGISCAPGAKKPEPEEIPTELEEDETDLLKNMLKNTNGETNFDIDWAEIKRQNAILKAALDKKRKEKKEKKSGFPGGAVGVCLAVLFLAVLVGGYMYWKKKQSSTPLMQAQGSMGASTGSFGKQGSKAQRSPNSERQGPYE